jgi:hypothetical protein
MRLFVPSSLVLWATLALCGCGGKDNPTGPNNNLGGGTITLSGAVSQRLTGVVFTGVFDPTSRGRVMATVQGPLEVNIEISFPDDLQTGSWTEMTTPGPSMAAISVIDQTGHAWSAIGAGGIVLRGAFTLAITSIGTGVITGGVKIYPNLRGSLSATLPATAGGATNTVTLAASF